MMVWVAPVALVVSKCHQKIWRNTCKLYLGQSQMIRRTRTTIFSWIVNNMRASKPATRAMQNMRVINSVKQNKESEEKI